MTRNKPEGISNYHWLLNGWVDVGLCSNSVALLTFTRQKVPVYEYWGISSTVSRTRTCLSSFSGMLIACCRASWTCSCFHCCWICMTFIQFTFVDFVHRVWCTHLSNMRHHQWTDRTTREALHHSPPCRLHVHSNWRNKQHDSLLIHW